MRTDVLRSLMEVESHSVAAPPAWREVRARYHCDLMWVGVKLAVELVVYDIVDAGGRDFLSRLEFCSLVRHITLLSRAKNAMLVADRRVPGIAAEIGPALEFHLQPLPRSALNANQHPLIIAG